MNEGRDRVFMQRKVMIYYGGFLGKSGGAFMHARSIKNVLENNGWIVDVITLDRLPIYVRFLPHIVSCIVNTVNPPIGYFYKDSLTKLLYKYFFDYRVQLRIFEDIYISWDSDIPSVTLLHAVWSDNLQSLTLNAKQKRKLIYLEFKNINAIQHPVVTVSEPYLKYLVKEHYSKYDLRKIEVIPLGVDLSKFYEESTVEKDSMSIVYCGSLEARKNIYFLLEVFKKLHMSDSGYKLTLIGDGPDRHGLQKFCSDNNLPVNFVGRLEHDNAIKEIRRHRIYLHTSVKESFSFALLEAKLCGLMTIAYSNLEVPSEFIDIPVSSFDVDSWCQAINLNYHMPTFIFDRNKYSSTKMAKDTLMLVNIPLSLGK